VEDRKTKITTFADVAWRNARFTEAELCELESGVHLGDPAWLERAALQLRRLRGLITAVVQQCETADELASESPGAESYLTTRTLRLLLETEAHAIRAERAGRVPEGAVHTSRRPQFSSWAGLPR